jgi:hypothetical protein
MSRKITELTTRKTPTSLKMPVDDKAREARLSVQNNPDGFPWINNKVIKESYVGKRKSAS